MLQNPGSAIRPIAFRQIIPQPPRTTQIIGWALLCVLVFNSLLTACTPPQAAGTAENAGPTSMPTSLPQATLDAIAAADAAAAQQTAEAIALATEAASGQAEFISPEDFFAGDEERLALFTAALETQVVTIIQPEGLISGIEWLILPVEAQTFVFAAATKNDLVAMVWLKETDTSPQAFSLWRQGNTIVLDVDPDTGLPLAQPVVVFSWDEQGNASFNPGFADGAVTSILGVSVGSRDVSPFVSAVEIPVPETEVLVQELERIDELENELIVSAFKARLSPDEQKRAKLFWIPAGSEKEGYVLAILDGSETLLFGRSGQYTAKELSYLGGYQWGTFYVTATRQLEFGSTRVKFDPVTGKVTVEYDEKLAEATFPEQMESWEVWLAGLAAEELTEMEAPLEKTVPDHTNWVTGTKHVVEMVRFRLRSDGIWSEVIEPFPSGGLTVEPIFEVPGQPLPRENAIALELVDTEAARSRVYVYANGSVSDENGNTKEGLFLWGKWENRPLAYFNSETQAWEVLTNLNEMYGHWFNEGNVASRDVNVGIAYGRGLVWGTEVDLLLTGENGFKEVGGVEFVALETVFLQNGVVMKVWLGQMPNDGSKHVFSVSGGGAEITATEFLKQNLPPGMKVRYLFVPDFSRLSWADKEVLAMAYAAGESEMWDHIVESRRLMLLLAANSDLYCKLADRTITQAELDDFLLLTAGQALYEFGD